MELRAEETRDGLIKTLTLLAWLTNEIVACNELTDLHHTLFSTVLAVCPCRCCSRRIHSMPTSVDYYDLEYALNKRHLMRIQRIEQYLRFFICTECVATLPHCHECGVTTVDWYASAASSGDPALTYIMFCDSPGCDHAYCEQCISQLDCYSYWRTPADHEFLCPMCQPD